MAVVAIVAIDNDEWWPSGVWTAHPVLTAGKWRWVVELYRGGSLRHRRTVGELWRL